MAKEYTIPPWVIERDASQEWWDRMNCLSEEMENMPKSKDEAAGGE